jgi:methionine aminopeptidase
VGASVENPVAGRRADVLKAAWHAAEAAMRTVKVGNRNWAVTEIVGRTSAAWDCKPVEGTCYFKSGIAFTNFIWQVCSPVNKRRTLSTGKNALF